MKFLIGVTTLNRNLMLNEAIRSVFQQSYPEWQLIVSDNASDTPVESTIPDSFLKDPRVSIVRHDKRLSGEDHGNSLLRHAHKFDYDYLLLAHDDDILLPFALDLVRKYNDNAGMVACTVALYCEASKTLKYERQLHKTQQPPCRIDAMAGLQYNARPWGIRLSDDSGKTRLGCHLGITHSGAYYMSKNLVERVLERFDDVFDVPLGDVSGYGKFAITSGSMIYINRPAAVIRFHDSSDTTLWTSGKHHGEQKVFQYSPVKATTFSNMSLEAYLKLMNELEISYSDRIHPSFFLRHIKEILRVRPYTSSTRESIRECLPHLLHPASLVESGCWMAGRLAKRISEALLINRQFIEISPVDSIWEAADKCVSKFG